MSDEEMEQGPDAVVERLRALTNELESLASDRGLISALSPAERTRLFNAAGNLFEPDVARRRQSGKAARRRAKASKLERDEAVLSETGIRVLRKKPVFTSPNVFAPSAFEQEDVEDDPGFRDLVESQHCYVCKRHYVEIHPFYDQLCPECGDFNYRKRSETGHGRGLRSRARRRSGTGCSRHTPQLEDPAPRRHARRVAAAGAAAGASCELRASAAWGAPAPGAPRRRALSLRAL